MNWHIERLGYRLLCCVFGWGTVGIIYKLTANYQKNGYSQAKILPPSFIDEWIVFSSGGVWLYLSFFLLIPLSYLFCPLFRVRWLMFVMQGCALFSGVVYLLYPTTLDYPPVTGDKISDHVLRYLIEIDSSQNCLPSLHASLTVLSVYAMWQGKQKFWRLLWVTWGILIGFSIIQLRRHLLIDIVAGILTAIAISILYLIILRIVATRAYCS
ncbi:inositol phosphorylceramide synthase [Xenorhabdus mauleonii]|uniref:Inositol phosphorylceramide synthase n=1 Tax=Xenorhabdus mauleonii TaxID=351675 RepID=A0A1I3KGX4_9GAMM|nr:phosphatase PAP2 family protein [Xenorhabdus mauleonii]PHM45049.1 inositol phosphorylceramide synthase [Xenorhabdus mauleonii]SFI71771.1 PAP2 superfamily protein [Xenorhabdus mauleonii]